MAYITQTAVCVPAYSLVLIGYSDMHEPHQFFLVVHIQPVETNSQMCN